MKFISNALTLFIIAALVVIWLQGRPKEHASANLSERDLWCLTQNIFWEARGENDLGQAAVAHVTLNRVRAPAYPDSVCEVVWQPGQFSWTEDGRSDRMTDLDAIDKAVDITLAAARGKIKDPTGGALHYFAHRKVRPDWAKGGFRFILGEHTFVKMVGR
jgi:spore germination cell wall hydrolase CwlJ-like protein